MNLRKCEIVQEVEYLPGGDNWKEELLKRLTALQDGRIVGWALILHDKDTDKDGNPVKPHIHLVCEFSNSLSTKTIGNYFGIAPQYVSKIKATLPNSKYADIGSALSYLCHRNAEDKYQYSDDEVIAMDGYNWREIRAKSELSRERYKKYTDVIEGIMAGEIRRYSLVEYINIDDYIEYSSDFSTAFEFADKVARNNKYRKLITFYIHGEAGAGKSVLAKNLCEDYGLNYYLSDSGTDFLDGYAGEEAIILDDFRPTNANAADVLKLIDPYSSSAVRSRYHNKVVQASIIIITTIHPLESFWDLLGSVNEPIGQFKRRCQVVINVTDKEITLKIFNKKTKDYDIIGTAPNELHKQFDDFDNAVNDDIVKALCRLLGIAKDNATETKGDS